ncbi:hypothetical protein H2198_007510 [Neophaeococcomyces mojaviensis]|uniref:Uncharacterized protein n=1 Tax=Neophaeococcomyces mojaviensis TaxID=3383035 RepID=A0ACC2ZZQ6_9EURO|nr:hypothetical protein H2198_007510 [Knufia sp. JES_112]
MQENGVSFNLNRAWNLSSFSASKVANDPFQRYYGIQSLNLSYPEGTSDYVVVPQFEPVTALKNTTALTAFVDGFATYLDCEVVQPTLGPVFEAPWNMLLADFFSIDIETPSCNLSAVIAGQGPKYLDPLVDPVLQQYQGWWGNYTCNSGVNIDEYPPGEAPIDPGLTDHRLVITTSLVKWNQTAPNRNTWLDKFTTLLCNASYGINQYQVNLPQSNQDVGKPVQATRVGDGDEFTVSDVSNLDIILAVKAATSGAPLGYGGIYHEPSAETAGLASGDLMEPDQFFLLLQAMKGDADIDAFMDPTTLLNYATRAFTGVFTQIAHDYLLQSSNQTIVGSISYVESRLQVEPVSFGLLLAFLITALMISVLLAEIAPRDVVTRNPQSLGAAATLLASSFDLQRSMRNLGACSTSTLKDTLSRYSFQTHAKTDRFQITTVKNRKPVGAGILDNSTNSLLYSGKWWNSLALETWYASLAILLPLFTIAALQTVQVVSDSRNGFINISEDSSQKVWYVYIPALVLACEATLYTSIQFSTALLAPLLKMRSQAVSASCSLSSDMVSLSYLEALHYSFRDGYYSSVVSIVAAFLGLSLTTVSSGLYYVENVPLTRPMTVMRHDMFNLSTPNANLWPGDYFAGAVTGLIFYNNLSFPQWTHEDLIFPQLKIATDVHDASSSMQTSLLNVQIPALRPSLDCSVEDNSTIAYPTQIEQWPYTAQYGNPDAFYGLPFTALMPTACGFYDRSSVIPPNQSFPTRVPFNDTKTYNGLMIDLQWYLASSLDNLVPIPDVIPCKATAFIFSRSSASIVAGNTDNITTDDLKLRASSQALLITCYQRIEEVMVDAVLSLPNFTIDVNHPPKPIESTARYISSGSGSINFNFQTEQHMRYEMETTHIDAPDNLHPAIYAMVHGRWGVPSSEIFDHNGAAKFMEAANRVWGYYMVQAININFRQQATASIDNQSLAYTGTLVQEDRGRLKQDAAVKRTLQAMLGLMSVCGILIYLTIDGKQVLPHDPCSIAGMMSLYAGSDLTEREDLIVPGSEWNSVKDDERMWEGWLFSLGWWKTSGDGWRYGIDIGVAEKYENKQTVWKQMLATKWQRLTRRH